MAQRTDRITLDPNSYADTIKMILKHFLQMKISRKSSRKTSGCLVIDIQLLLESDFYTVQITQCGRWSERGIENLLNDFYLLVKNGQLPNKVVLAYVFARANAEEEEVVYEIQGAPEFVRKKISQKIRLIHFPSFKNYVLIKLQYKLSPNHLLEFKEILLREFDMMKESHRDVKIMFYFGKDIFYNNNVGSDVDYQDCRLLSLPLIAIMKQSMNSKFKERCFETLGVNSAYDAQKVLVRTLFSMTHENYMIP